MSKIKLPSPWLLLFFLWTGLLIPVWIASYVEPDFFWQLKEGENLVNAGILPLQDHFSFTAAGRSLSAHEWLAEGLYFLIFSKAGLGGIAVLHLLLYWGSFGMLWILLHRFQIDPCLRGCLLVLTALAFLNYYSTKPQNFSIFLTAITMWCVLAWEAGRRLGGRILAGLLLVWPHLHGGFLVGWGVLAIMAFYEFRKAGLRSEVLWLWTSVTLFICLLHPSHGTVLAYPFWYVFAAPPLIGDFREWAPLNFSEFSTLPYLILLLALLWTGLRRAGRPFPWGPVVAGLLVLSLRGRKMLPVFTLFAVIFLASQLKEVALRPVWRRAWFLLTLLLAGFMTRTVWARARGIPWENSQQVLEARYPRLEAEYIRDRYPGRRLFHPYGWGGYLIYKLFPKNLVFLDGRMDLYWKLYETDYKEVEEVRPHWQDVLDSWKIDLVLARRPSRLAYALRGTPEWTPVLEGPLAIVFSRRSPLP